MFESEGSEFDKSDDEKKIVNKIYRNLVIIFVVVVYLFLFIKLMFF